MDSNSSRKKIKPKPSSFPSPNLFPFNPPVNSLPSSKYDLLRLIAVVSIAAAVAATCNFIANSLNPPPRKPFCDTLTSDSDDFLPVSASWSAVKAIGSRGVCALRTGMLSRQLKNLCVNRDTGVATAFCSCFY